MCIVLSICMFVCVFVFSKHKTAYDMMTFVLHSYYSIRQTRLRGGRRRSANTRKTMILCGTVSDHGSPRNDVHGRHGRKSLGVLASNEGASKKKTIANRLSKFHNLVRREEPFASLCTLLTCAVCTWAAGMLW